MKKNIFNIIAVLLFVFIIIYLPLKIVYYDQKISDADEEYTDTLPKGSIATASTFEIKDNNIIL